MFINGAWRSTASAPALGAGGPEFKSRRPDILYQIITASYKTTIKRCSNFVLKQGNKTQKPVA